MTDVLGGTSISSAFATRSHGWVAPAAPVPKRSGRSTARGVRSILHDFDSLQDSEQRKGWRRHEAPLSRQFKDRVGEIAGLQHRGAVKSV
ncbi:hypothetical protein BDQ17DRAFT_1353414 [Cyathus striatus]|nr:hypothetical protein BDQ17DRAFT_1353414 [Cyathus striatus]